MTSGVGTKRTWRHASPKSGMRLQADVGQRSAELSSYASLQIGKTLFDKLIAYALRFAGTPLTNCRWGCSNL